MTRMISSRVPKLVLSLAMASATLPLIGCGGERETTTDPDEIQAAVEEHQEMANRELQEIRGGQ